MTLDQFRELWVWILPIGAGLFSIICFLFLKNFILARFTKAGISVAALSTPLTALALVGGVSISVGLADFISHQFPFLEKAIKLSFIIAFSWLSMRFATLGIERAPLPNNVTASHRSLALLVTRIAIISMSALISLDSLGISITPILASLGIGSLAVGLALQDTLNNFFSGLYLQIDQPIRVGDFVELEGGMQGRVVEIGWRSSQLLTITNNIIVIPNAKFSSTVITNFDLINSDISIILNIGVAYESNLEIVEQVTYDVARQILESEPNAVSDFDPLIRFTSFGNSSIDLMLIFRVKQFTDQALIKHKMIKAIHSRYAVEKIEIPFPHQVITLSK